ncbi:type II secretion system (T2SS), F family protein [Collimonas arenae]|uniref:Type II secretion system (T2SS), F family protein n=2 Tax=Collimonas arenae TaxID=279058 RepID=A0A127QKQ4_9BURK|nr:type II secretion system F family protein [Collimonas arenae]AMP00713.1 type II secretion system (T2SS), F family protein [Collimonas arenae]AMP10603.1 type II secretion system (T2SS), F family protein [Collimonas arenae]
MDNTIIQIALALGFAVAAVLVAYASWAAGRQMMARYRDSVLDSTSAQLSDLFIFMDGAKLQQISIVTTILFPLLAFVITRNMLVVVVTAAICLFGPTLAHKNLKKRRRKKLIHQLPDSLDSLVGALRSGMSVTQSMGLLAEQLPKPSNQEFALVVRKLRMGVGVDEVLTELEERVNSQEYTMFTTSMRIAREVGGNLTESLERLADTMRKKLAMEDKIQALTSQGKLQGLIVGSLPLFLMWVLNEMEPEAMAPLFNTWIGYGVLVVVFLLELVGFVLIRKIVLIDV